METNSGLQGLGNINTDNASATVATPYGYLNKVQDDNRKLEVNFAKFNSDEDLGNYILNWLQQSCGLEAHIATDNETDATRGIPAIYTSVPVTNGTILTYKIYCIRNNEDLQIFLNHSNIPVGIQAQLVVYGNYSVAKLSQTERQLKQNGIECFSLEDIYDINNSIDLADKKLPYMGIGNTKLSTILAKVLNNKYKQSAQGSIINTQGMKSDVSELGGAFQSGFGQLKESITDAIGSLKGLTKQNNSQPSNRISEQTINQNIPNESSDIQ